MTPKKEPERASSGAAPKSGETSARRGRVRDALAALGSAAAMLRSRRRSEKAVDKGELRGALAALREAFGAAGAEAQGEQRDARRALDAFVTVRVARVEAAVESPPALAEALDGVRDDLDTAAGLLELAERGVEGAAVDVSIAALAEQALRLAWTMRARDAIGVHVRPSDQGEDCLVTCDPQVVARALAIAVAKVRETSPAVVVRTRVEADAGVLEVAGFTSADVSAIVMQTRVTPAIDATEAILRAAASAAGIGLIVEPTRVLLRCPRVV